MFPGLTEQQLNSIAMENDPFPILEMLNQSQGVGSNMLTVPGGGATPAPEPGTMAPFTNALTPQAPKQRTTAPLDPASLSLLARMNVQPASRAVAPGMPAKSIQLNPLAAGGAQQRTALPPSLGQILYGGR